MSAPEMPPTAGPSTPQEVSPLELFFDLVLVFAITQVTGFVSGDPTWTRLLQGAGILATLWWAWVAFAWLANSAASDEGAVRVVLLSAMGALLIVSLAVPNAFGDDALVFGVAYLTVRCLHLGAYRVVSRGNPEPRGVVTGLAVSSLPAASLLVLAGVLDGTARGLCWVLALGVDYGALALRGVEGWRVEPAHFAERHALIIIIALGESIVAVGVGAHGLPLHAELIAAALLGIATVGAMWWAYFDVVAIVAARRFRALDRLAQARMARDSYTYLHLPMVLGIIVFAVGLKRTVGHVDAHLHTVEAFCLCAGLALYLVALSAFKRRNIGSWNRGRIVVAGTLLVLWPVATELPALAALGSTAALACGLIGWEAIRMAEARDRIRHPHPD